MDVPEAISLVPLVPSRSLPSPTCLFFSSPVPIFIFFLLRSATKKIDRGKSKRDENCLNSPELIAPRHFFPFVIHVSRSPFFFLVPPSVPLPAASSLFCELPPVFFFKMSALPRSACVYTVVRRTKGASSFFFSRDSSPLFPGEEFFFHAELAL